VIDENRIVSKQSARALKNPVFLNFSLEPSQKWNLKARGASPVDFAEIDSGHSQHGSRLLREPVRDDSTVLIAGSAGLYVEKEMNMRGYENRKAFLAYAGSIAAMMVMLAITACKEKSDAGKPLSMVITFTSGDVKVVRDGKEVPAAIGMVVYEKDLIRTENGTVDLQTRTGSAVRVREMTSLTVAKIAGQDGGETRINVEHGGMLANVKKASANEGFNVATPTAIAGVRGTSFSVEVDPFERTSSVKVFDGKVAMAPRIQALETAKPEEIESNPALRKMAELAKKEVVIEEKKEGRLNPDIEKKVLAVNELISKAEEGKFETVSKELEKVAAEAGNLPAEKLVVTSEARITDQDIVEKETLIAVDASVLEKVADGKTNESAVQVLKDTRQQKQEEILKKIEEAASRNNLKDEKQIQKHYNKLETLILQDGSQITGAVIAQTGDILIVHSPKGVRRINKADVVSQEFR
jgi:hypothetical protein